MQATQLELPQESGVPPISSVLFQPATPPPNPANSPSRSPRRLHTDPEGGHSNGDLRLKVFKRIIVCCDGTWQDGISKQRSHYTNVLRLARSINHEDKLFLPAIPQIVFYQSGIGTENNFYSEYIEGTTGCSLADKVEEAYAFIAHNYNPGDEIFLFGFSRGAYTARMVAMFIGEIGVLDRKDMDSFASIFINYQNLGTCEDPIKKKDLEEKLALWRSPESKGKRRADVDNDNFTIQFLGVWDTVGALGMPEEIPFGRKVYNLFGFPDRLLGDHIKHTCQALALNEMRIDFNCNKFIQTEAGRKKNQILRQCWFAGCHTDVGGGYKNHDLSDLTLIWMASEVESYLSLDLEYLEHLPQPVAPWGTQQPHDSATGIFLLANTVERTLPTVVNDPETHEYIHPSVLHQKKVNQNLSAILKDHPAIICSLNPLEEQMRKKWPYDEKSPEAQVYAARLKAQSLPGMLTVAKTTSWIRTLIRSVSQSSTSIDTETGTVVYDSSLRDSRQITISRRQLS